MPNDVNDDTTTLCLPDVECKLLVYQHLITKVFHARAGAETDKFKRKYLSRRKMGAATKQAFCPILACTIGQQQSAGKEIKKEGGPRQLQSVKRKESNKEGGPQKKKKKART